MRPPCSDLMKVHVCMACGVYSGIRSGGSNCSRSLSFFGYAHGKGDFKGDARGVLRACTALKSCNGRYEVRYSLLDLVVQI